MRCSGWSSLAISVCSALVLAGTASAHVVATPGFLPSGSSESITFSGPNERDDPMTAFSLTAPAGFTIEHAHEVAGWDESVDGSTATWTGGPLAPDVELGFGMTLRADAGAGDPRGGGAAELRGRKRRLVARRTDHHPRGGELLAERRPHWRRSAHRCARGRRDRDARLASSHGQHTSREIADAAGTVGRGHDLYAVRRRRARVCVVSRRRSGFRSGRRRRSGLRDRAVPRRGRAARGAHRARNRDAHARGSSRGSRAPRTRARNPGEHPSGSRSRVPARPDGGRRRDRSRRHRPSLHPHARPSAGALLPRGQPTGRAERTRGSSSPATRSSSATLRGPTSQSTGAREPRASSTRCAGSSSSGTASRCTPVTSPVRSAGRR